MTAEPAAGDAADLDAADLDAADLDAADLDDAGRRGGSPRPAAHRRRRSRLLPALLALVVVGALGVAQQVERSRQSQVRLVAVDGGLLAIGQPASAVADTLVAVEVALRNEGPAAVTVRSVRTGGAGQLLDDDLAVGGEGRGADRGTRLQPSAVRTVILSGVLICPGPSAPEPVTGDLTVVAEAADGTERTVEVAAPPGAEWREAVSRACAAGPDDSRPAMA